MTVFSWSIWKATSGNIITHRWDLKTPYQKSDRDTFDLVESDFLAAAIIELRGARVCMLSHIAGFFSSDPPFFR
ncbi:Hypothetical protein NGAL_HAMBI1146_58060 [Neorhizobium galegae bv. officinalis]|nr:Hypothetical protein NGAL_HAMBI1146_58060 [Neorhizobium galegae bv. officinalis]